MTQQVDCGYTVYNQDLFSAYVCKMVYPHCVMKLFEALFHDLNQTYKPTLLSNK